MVSEIDAIAKGTSVGDEPQDGVASLSLRSIARSDTTQKKVATFIGVFLVCASAYAGKPAPITSYPPDWPHRAPFKLNRELLLPESERIVFVVDVQRGPPLGQL